MRKLHTPLVCLLLYVAALSGAPPSQNSSFTGKHGMVVAQEGLAADVGISVLKHGGNAVDAAVAVGFALAVTHPSAGNIGGGGFMLVRFSSGKTAFLDFREAAPGHASRDMYLGPDGQVTHDSVSGWRSSGVPGTVAGLAQAHKEFGSKRWKDLLDPAIRLARDGFTVGAPLADEIGQTKRLKTDPESSRIYLPEGRALSPGTIWRQPELAHTLERIAEGGAEGFYQGASADRLVAEMAAHGGLITADDLRAYRVKQRTPLEGDYHGFHIITAPPPSAGGVGLLQMLTMVEGTGYEDGGATSPKALHYEAEAMRRAYADRSEYLADPDYYNVPVKELLDPKYLAWRRSTIAPEAATPSDAVHPGLPKIENARVDWIEGPQTTHYNVVDATGNAVAVTYTLNDSFGNGITVPGLGFLLNDEMDDFVAKPGSPNMFGLTGGDANAIEPGKRPLSSMTPTIALRNNKFAFVLGAPGGSRITTAVFTVMLDIIDFHLSPQAAIDLPRVHEQWKPDVLYVEDGFPPATTHALTTMGYDLRPNPLTARVQAIVSHDGVLEGGTDGRERGGKVAGY